MKVLFVSRENPHMGTSPIIKNQAESLIRAGLDVEFFLIKGKGISGYLKSIYPLRKRIKKKKYDIIHSHYSLSAFTASMAGAKPMVVSLMGSDVKSQGFYRILIRIFYFFFWKACIVKSRDMKKVIGLKSAFIISNGVDFTKFRPMQKEQSIKKIGFPDNRKNILFAADPDRFEKNFSLASDACKLIGEYDYELHCLKNVPNNIMPFYYNASDVVLLTSLWEGSPNVIKEAMACNRPIVSTDVGDVKEIVNDTDGCFACKFSSEEIALKLKIILKNYKSTNGREKIKHLDEKYISSKIIHIYNQILVNGLSS